MSTIDGKVFDELDLASFHQVLRLVGLHHVHVDLLRVRVGRTARWHRLRLWEQSTHLLTIVDPSGLIYLRLWNLLTVCHVRLKSFTAHLADLLAFQVLLVVLEPFRVHLGFVEQLLQWIQHLHELLLARLTLGRLARTQPCVGAVVFYEDLAATLSLRVQPDRYIVAREVPAELAQESHFLIPIVGILLSVELAVEASLEHAEGTVALFVAQEIVIGDAALRLRPVS